MSNHLQDQQKHKCNLQNELSTDVLPFLLGIDNRTLADASDDTDAACSKDGSGAGQSGGGEMARRLVIPTATQASGATSSAVVELNTAIPFTFDTSNATDVIDQVYSTPIIKVQLPMVNVTEELPKQQLLTSICSQDNYLMVSLEFQ